MSVSFPDPGPRLALLAAALLIAGAGDGLAQTAPPAADAALCVFQDRSYSEGATVCPQVRFMLMCSAEGTKLVWKAVADRALADRCLRPTLVTEAPDPVRFRRQRIARSPPPTPPPVPAAGTSAKCFTFNNKRYCE